jgi:hypothetical protein
VLLAQRLDAAQIAGGREVDAALPLDRLDENRRDVRVHRPLDRAEVAVREHRESGGQRAEAVLVLRLLEKLMTVVVRP